MISRANSHVVALAAAVTAAALAAPQLGWASSGGASLGGAPRAAAPSGSGVQPGDVTVSASGNGVTIAARASGFYNRALRFTGNASSAAAGHIIEIERSGHQTHGAWTPTTHGRVRPDGSFTATWPANHIGRFAFRAVVLFKRHSARAASSSPAVTVTVYRFAIATQYGPGFYGSQTACGQRLTKRMLGVANRTLPCGTPVSIYWHGKTLTVPVIDRGPYANNADWDLTEATGRALGINGTAVIGAVSVPR